MYAYCKRNEVTVGKTVLPVGRMFGCKIRKGARKLILFRAQKVNYTKGINFFPAA
jgi:hypothetical protein